MKMNLAALALPQLDTLLEKFAKMNKQGEAFGSRNIQSHEATALIAAGMAALQRYGGINSPYFLEARQSIEKIAVGYGYARAMIVYGALKSLREDIAEGYLDTIEKLIHASVFADFLEMAEHLLSEGYKDPAAVLIGSVLEEHLRKLCATYGVDTETVDTNGDTRPRKADTLNADLAKANAYNKLDQKNVTAWLDLRNKAAHGKYGEYTQA